MPLVSIITSAYNATPYLEDCAKSVLSQTFQDFEWILINDGSTDKTLEMIQSLAESDPRIVVIDGNNKGLAGARNVGLEKMSGKYFCYLDADDLCAESHLSLCVPLLEEHPELDFVSFSHTNVPEDFAFSHINKTQENEQPQGLKIYHHAWKNFTSSKAVDRNNWNKVYRTSTLGNFRYIPEIKRAQDVAYGWRIRQGVQAFATIENSLIYYRQNTNGVSKEGINEKYIHSMFYVAKALFEDHIKPEMPLKSRRRFMQEYLATFIFKSLLKNRDKTPNAALQKQMDDSIGELLKTGVFTPAHLPLRKRWQAAKMIRKMNAEPLNRS